MDSKHKMAVALKLIRGAIDRKTIGNPMTFNPADLDKPNVEMKPLSKIIDEALAEYASEGNVIKVSV